MPNIKYQSTRQAHGRSQISNMIINNNSTSPQLITVGYDGYLRVWCCQTLHLKRQVQIHTAYIMGLYSHKNGLYVGIGTGEILSYDLNFNLIKSFKIHTDIISHFLTYKDYLITISYDGSVKLLRDMVCQHTFFIGSPITYAVISDNRLYLACNPARIIELDTWSITKLKNRYEYYLVVENRVYGSSDEKGLTFLNKNTNTYLPCQFMLGVEDLILFTSEEAIGLLHHKQQISWKVLKEQVLKPGYSIKAGVFVNNQVFLASECGNIFKFKIINSP